MGENMDIHDIIMAKVAIFKDGKWKHVETRLYYKFQSALQDVIDGSPELFDDVPEEYLPDEFKQPFIYYGGVSPKTERPTDFEFRYINSKCNRLNVFVGTIIIEDEEVKVCGKE